MLLDCVLYQEGRRDGVRGPRNATCRKAPSGSPFALPRLFPIYSYIFNYFVYFSLQLGSHCLLAVNGGGFCHHTMIQYDKSLFSDDSSLRGNKYEMLTNCTSAETSVSGINILIFIRTVVSKSYHCKWKSTQISFILLWQLGKGDPRDEVICQRSHKKQKQERTVESNRRVMLSPSSSSESLRKFSKLLFSDLLPHGSLPES